jgi:fatty-acyl-CoA synthase
MIVPMYHANAWGLVYSAPAVGAKLVLPGQKLDGASVYELMEQEEVTFSSGVPTVWQMLLAHLRETKSRFSTLKRITVGGSACPESLIRTFHDDYGVEVIQGWGMTETSPLATVSVPNARVATLSFDEQVAFSLKQGRLLAGLELKLVDETGARLPHDGRSVGRLKIKGATIAKGYFGGDGDEAFDPEGFLDTGDIARIDHDGYMQITDRAKDVIKSGGEWISSIEVENIAMGHPKVALAAVIGIAHPKWDERPLLIIEPKKNEAPTKDEILLFLKDRIARWWMPDDVVFVEALALGSTGKLDKRYLRDRFKDHKIEPGS